MRLNYSVFCHTCNEVIAWFIDKDAVLASLMREYINYQTATHIAIPHSKHEISWQIPLHEVKP